MKTSSKRLAAARRNNVTVAGRRDGRPIVFAHGFGCDQTIWRRVAPAFEADFQVVLFDHVGAGGSDLRAYDSDRYAALDGYAADVLEICAELDLADVVLVGHSVGASVGAVAAAADPSRLDRLVMVAPSPCFVSDGDYVGGLTRADVDGLLDALAANFLGWSAEMAPAIMGNPDRPELADELFGAFCRTDPEIAQEFARVAFLADTRPVLPQVHVPSLIVQCSDDFLVPCAVGDYMRRALPAAELVVLDAHGHCPHVSVPEATVAAIRSFV